MKRYLEPLVAHDLDEKMVLLSGPRQVGKTTVAKALYPGDAEYFNMDSGEHRLLIQKKAWRRDCPLVILDELHKIKKWKSWLKGVYDTEGNRPRLLVTGSSRMDVYRKGGDSLAGRFFSFRLHPFSVAEMKGSVAPEKALDQILKLGGFPEPFLKGSVVSANRWRRSHIDRILREDLLEETAIRDLRGIETLVELLKNSVSSLISFESLARDLQVSPHSVKLWIRMLEDLHVLFVVTPYSHNIARSLLKQPKIYFYDTGFVKDDAGARFENAVACALLKRQHFLEDTQGDQCAMHYLRDKHKREVDFILLRNGKPESIIEVKMSDVNVSGVRHFSSFVPKNTQRILLIKNLKRELLLEGVQVKRAASWLAELEA